MPIIVLLIMIVLGGCAATVKPERPQLLFTQEGATFRPSSQDTRAMKYSSYLNVEPGVMPRGLTARLRVRDGAFIQGTELFEVRTHTPGYTLELEVVRITEELGYGPDSYRKPTIETADYACVTGRNFAQCSKDPTKSPNPQPYLQKKTTTVCRVSESVEPGPVRNLKLEVQVQPDGSVRCAIRPAALARSQNRPE